MLTTLDNVKEFLGLSVSNFDAVLDTLITNVSSWIESQCDTKFEEKSITNELYSLNYSSDFLILNNSKVTSIDKIEVINGGTVGNPTYEEISSDDYSLDNDSIYYPSKFIAGINRYRVSYTYGYSTVPSDLEMLATKLVSRIFDKSKSQGKSSESIDGASVNWQGTLDEIDKPILNKYKSYSV